MYQFYSYSTSRFVGSVRAHSNLMLYYVNNLLLISDFSVNLSKPLDKIGTKINFLI